MMQQHCLTGWPRRVFRIGNSSAAPHAVEDIHANYAIDWGCLWVLDGLHDAVQGAILVPYPSAYDILPLVDEAEREGAQPVYYLTSLITWSAFDNAVV